MSIFVIFFCMRILRLIYIYSLLSLPLLSAGQTCYPKHEYRAVWLTTIENLDWPRTQVKSVSDIEVQKSELVAILDSLKMLNINCVMLQTRVRGDVIYPSSIEPFAKALTGTSGKSPGYDPLAFAIEECHKRSMQLHAWVVALPLGSATYVREQGRMSLKKRKPKLCRYYKDNWYMEPGEPAVADYLCTIVKEIIDNYHVDGIHLDYIRYPDRPKGYPDGSLHKRYGKGLTLADWRRSNITNIVERVYTTVKEAKPWVRVSCAPLGKHDDLTSYSSLGWNARETVFQDAQEWMRLGIMDALFPMLYFKGNDFYPFVLDWSENSHSRHIAPGMGTYRLLPEYGGWPVLELQRQLFTSRTAGASGSVMFRTHHLLDSTCNFFDVYASLHRYKALIPPMTWCSNTLPAAPEFIHGCYRGDTLSLRWSSVDSSTGHPAMRYNVYISSDSIPDINDVSSLVSTMQADTTFLWSASPYSNINCAVTAVDAYGTESVAAYWSNKGYSSVFKRRSFLLPEPVDWGMRVILRDAVGAGIYNGPYSTTIGVSGIAEGVYTLEIVTRDGKVVDRIFFCK